MAIEKEKILDNGAVGNYWRIITVTANTMSLKINGCIGLFKDKAFSDAGGQPMLIKDFRFSFTKGEFAAAPNILVLAYTKILAQAAETLNYDINGQTIEPPRIKDPDLVGGIIVAD